ncbi:unnamed protein product [Amoebophrya sp. A120]|nr:unnamed protein product [Amoebophrya sp. A120]|eukprot:GSA120T00023084001.1
MKRCYKKASDIAHEFRTIQAKRTSKAAARQPAGTLEQQQRFGSAAALTRFQQLAREVMMPAGGALGKKDKTNSLVPPGQNQMRAAVGDKRKTTSNVALLHQMKNKLKPYQLRQMHPRQLQLYSMRTKQLLRHKNKVNKQTKPTGVVPESVIFAQLLSKLLLMANNHTVHAEVVKAALPGFQALSRICPKFDFAQWLLQEYFFFPTTTTVGGGGATGAGAGIVATTTSATPTAAGVSGGGASGTKGSKITRPAYLEGIDSCLTGSNKRQLIQQAAIHYLKRKGASTLEKILQFNSACWGFPFNRAVRKVTVLELRRSGAFPYIVTWKKQQEVKQANGGDMNQPDANDAVGKVLAKSGATLTELMAAHKSTLIQTFSYPSLQQAIVSHGTNFLRQQPLAVKTSGTVAYTRTSKARYVLSSGIGRSSQLYRTQPPHEMNKQANKVHLMSKFSNQQHATTSNRTTASNATAPPTTTISSLPALYGSQTSSPEYRLQKFLLTPFTWSDKQSLLSETCLRFAFMLHNVKDRIADPRERKQFENFLQKELAGKNLWLLQALKLPMMHQLKEFDANNGSYYLQQPRLLPSGETNFARLAQYHGLPMPEPSCLAKAALRNQQSKRPLLLSSSTRMLNNPELYNKAQMTGFTPGMNPDLHKEPDKQKLEEQAARIAAKSWLEKCMNVLGHMRLEAPHDYSKFDVNVLNQIRSQYASEGPQKVEKFIQKYQKTIRPNQPIDLMEIRTKLKNSNPRALKTAQTEAEHMVSQQGQYKNELQFKQDIKMMFENCDRFNRDEKNTFRQAGKRLEEIFARLWVVFFPPVKQHGSSLKIAGAPVAKKRRPNSESESES